MTITFHHAADVAVLAVLAVLAVERPARFVGR